MGVGQADTTKWWFGFRVKGTPGGTPSGWVPQGPYGTREEALVERVKAQAWDVEISPLFSAGSEAEAQEKCDTGRTS